MKNVFFLAIMVFALVSCEHNDYVDPIEGSPAFAVSGLRDGQPFTLAAGEDGLIQTANVERNKFGVLEWSSSFVEAGCADCDPVLKVTIHDVEGMTYENSANSTILNTGELAFASVPSDSGFTSCSFDLVYPLGNDDIQVLDFHLNGGQPINVFPVQLNPGINIVDADFSFDNNNNPEYTITQTVLAGSHHKLSAPFQFRFEEGEDGEPGHLQLLAPPHQPGGLRATSWETFAGNSNINNDDFDITLADDGFIRLNFHNDEVNEDGYYEISWMSEPEIFTCHEEDDNENCIQTVPAIQLTWATEEHNHGKIFIDYRYNGKHYTSVNPDQAASFIIAEKLPYSSTDTSGPNVNVRATFSVTLYEVGNPSNTIEFANCRGMLGFKVPE